MKRSVITALALLLFCPAFAGKGNVINDIDITVRLYRDGRALVHEIWDVESAQGTELYLVRSNLGDIEIKDFTVIDNGQEFVVEENWNTDRTLEEKQGRCGVIRKDNGVELCWGSGPYGPHYFHAIYVMTNVIKTMDDYDMLHLQLVSDGLSARPQHVRVEFFPPRGESLDSLSTRFWGFGFKGTTSFATDSTVVFESDSELGTDNSVIALMRFEKGLFHSASVREGSFDTVLATALEGSSFGYGETEEEPWYMLLLAAMFGGGVIYFLLVRPIKSIFGKKGGKAGVSAAEKRRVLGCSPSKVTWWRDLPFDGDLPASASVMQRLGEIDDCSSVAPAMILRMIYGGQLLVGKDSSGRTEISFAEGVKPDSLGKVQGQLFRILRESSGDDRVLQDKEFTLWAHANAKAVQEWVDLCSEDGGRTLVKGNLLADGRYTEAGQRKARETLGFKKFLNDFTLIRDKGSAEVHIWQEYLVYAALFGMSEKVAKELMDIDAAMAADVMKTDFGTFSDIADISRNLASAISIAHLYIPSSVDITGYGGDSGGGSGSSGLGGHSSTGGGRGFSGGGRGGGFR